MKCIVSRTSGAFPCNGAVAETVMYVDERTTDNPSELRMGKTAWYNIGTNHRTEGGHIFRDIMRDGYTIEIDSIESFVKEHGNCVVSVDKANQIHIEIYDDYRE